MASRKIRRVILHVRNIPGSNHKSYLAILFEICAWLIAHRGGINVYFDYELYLRGKKPGDYIKPHQFERIEKKLNTPEYYPILEDKYFFHQLMVGQGFRIPKNLFLIENSSIFNMDTKTYIHEEEFLRKDLDGFCKVINGFGGKMIYRIKVEDEKLKLNGNEMSVPDFIHFLGKRKFLVQERILQHKDMNVLNPSCINTLRMLTVRTGQTYSLYQVYSRIGINNNYVDNSLSGNIMIGVNRDTGKLMEYAYLLESTGADSKLARHPQTNVVFKDFSIPFFKESVEMVESLHVLFQQFFMIGWDIGITPEGPIVLEGNNITELYSYQVLYGGLKSSFFDIAEAYQRGL
ncbi:MAG: hypothetical protein IH594_06040 [Bacteroidales bacterium]|nr:hypothetical protein [Bacteroidales bacterium]